MKKLILDPLERVAGKKLFMSFQLSPSMMSSIEKLAKRSGLTRSKYCRICLQQAIARGDVFSVTRTEIAQ